MRPFLFVHLLGWLLQVDLNKADLNVYPPVCPSVYFLISIKFGLKVEVDEFYMMVYVWPDPGSKLSSGDIAAEPNLAW